MNEKPAENRIFTGNDKPLSAEQVGNIIKSPKFGLVQENKIKEIVTNSVLPQIRKARLDLQLSQAIDLIRPTKDGDLMADILKCIYAGYKYKRIAKTLMKSEKDGVPYFSSLGKAIDFVKKAEKEGLYRVKTMLSKKIIITG